MSSYKELLAQREQLDKQIKEAIALEKADGIAKAKAMLISPVRLNIEREK